MLSSGSTSRFASAAADSSRAVAARVSRSARALALTASKPATIADTSTMPSPPMSHFSRRFCREEAAARSCAAFSSASCSAWPASRNARSVSVSSSGCRAANSRPLSSLAPRQRSVASRWLASHSRAAIVRRRCTSRPAASSSSQTRSRGHSRNSASCATSTWSALTLSRRASASGSTTARTGCPAAQRGRRAHPLPRRRVAVAWSGQPQQQHPRGPLVGVGQAAVDPLGDPRHGTLDAAGRHIRGQREHVTAATVPELGHRR